MLNIFVLKDRDRRMKAAKAKSDAAEAMLIKIETERLEKVEEKRVAEENYRIEMERRKIVEEEEERREELLRIEQVGEEVILA